MLENNKFIVIKALLIFFHLIRFFAVVCVDGFNLVAVFVVVLSILQSLLILGREVCHDVELSKESKKDYSVSHVEVGREHGVIAFIFEQQLEGVNHDKNKLDQLDLGDGGKPVVRWIDVLVHPVGD